jgi:hypothetical protein
MVIQAMFIWKKRMYLSEQDGNTGDVYMEEKNVSFGTRWYYGRCLYGRKECIFRNKMVLRAMFIWKKRMYLLEQDGNTGDVYMEDVRNLVIMSFSGDILGFSRDTPPCY